MPCLHIRDSSCFGSRRPRSRCVTVSRHRFHNHSITMRPEGPRDPVAGPDAGPRSPFPLRIDGKVVKGFGRGSKEVSATLDTCAGHPLISYSSVFQPPIYPSKVSAWVVTKTSSLECTMASQACLLDTSIKTLQQRRKSKEQLYTQWS